MNYKNEIVKPTAKDKIFEVIVLMLLWWLFLILYLGFWIIDKIKGKKSVKEITKEEKLDRLMINFLFCKKL
ncbi:MAG: hypothetical protein V8R15_05240 [Bacilli bacterium]